MESFEEGDAWVGEGVTEPINFGFNATAKLLRADRKPWVRFEDIPAGGYEPAERLKELDEDLIDAAVFYPTPGSPRLSSQIRTPNCIWPWFRPTTIG